MKTRTLPLLAAALIAAANAAIPCAAAAKPLPPARVTCPPAAPADVETIAFANNAFACDLYAQFKATKGNLFFSPFSIANAFAMTATGARGKTEASIAKTLRSPFLGTRWHEANAALLEHLRTAPKKSGIKLTLANSLWPNLYFQPSDEFLAITKAKYGAKVAPLDYAQDEPAARATINDWVFKNTGEKIANILASPVPHDTRLILANAIHFKGDWATPFPEASTKSEPFHLANGQITPTPLMHLRAKIAHARIEKSADPAPETPPAAALIRLPYAGRQLAMLAILPDENTPESLATLENSLSAKNLELWLSQLRTQEVILTFPKFKIESGALALSRPLSALGMGNAFTPAADFSGINAKEGLFIGEAIHKAFVEVNETGTEAAAATVIGIRATSLQLKPPKPVEFRADHPFLFLIIDNTTRTILFMGRFATPPPR